MSDDFDQAQERLEGVAEGHGKRVHTRRTAIFIAVMAAVLALTEFGEKDAQANFLSSQITASDIWAQYQAKSVRRSIFSAEAELLESLKTVSTPAIQEKIAQARANASRMRSELGGDGMEQLMVRAHAQEHLRDHEEHRKNMLETASGGLQIAIVLASISVVVDLPVFMIVSVILGLASAIYGLVGELIRL